MTDEQKCIVDLVNFAMTVSDRLKKKDFTLFSPTSAIGGGLKNNFPPICRMSDELLSLHEEVIGEAMRAKRDDEENHKKRGAVMRLIDADNFLKFILDLPKRENGHSRTYDEANICRFIETQSTAYDVDNVIKSIIEIGQRYCRSVKCDKNCDDCEHGCLIRGITNAVKSGGVADE